MVAVTSAWRRLPDIPMRPRDGAMGLRTLESDVFAFGGYTFGREHRELFAISADGGSWDRRRDAPLPLARGTAVELRGRLHTWAFHQAFSQDRGSSCGGVAYDPASDAWEPVAPLPTGAREGSLLAASDDGALLWGGYTREHRAADDGFLYSATDDTWIPVAPGPLPPLGYGAAVWAGTEVIIWSRVGEVSHQAAYEPASKTWRLLPEPPIRPDGNMAAVWTGAECIFLGGSAPDGGGRRDVVAYNPVSDSWRQLPMLPERVNIPRVLWHDGRLTVVGYRAVHDLELDTGAGWESLERPPLPPGQNDATLVRSELWMPGFVRRAEPWVEQTSPMMALDLARSGAGDGESRMRARMAVLSSGLRVASGLAGYIATSSGAVHLVLRGSTVNGLDAMRRARAAIFEVPHPEEPSDPLPSFASSVELVDGAPSFWFEAADAEAYDGLIDQVISLVVAALESSGADGLLTWPGGPTA